MNPEYHLDFVRRAADALIRAAEAYGGLFPSMLDRRTGAMIEEAPEPIPGQRTGDRSYGGSNLTHDEPTLLTLRGLDAFLGEGSYGAVVDRYLDAFAKRCISTPSGNFPWGEHAYWDLRNERVGDSYAEANPGKPYDPVHDHLRQAPRWLLEAIYPLNTHGASKLAEGSFYHWTSEDKDEYCRHAPILRKAHTSRHPVRSCDFPRHSGFYIFNLAFAYSKTGRYSLRDEIAPFLDYWWEKRGPRGECRIESRNDESAHHLFDAYAPGQTLSLAASLLEAAEILDRKEPDIAKTMRERAGVYIEGFLAAPNDPEKGAYPLLYRASSDEITRHMPVWGSVYGGWPVCYVGLTALCAWRFTKRPELMAYAEAAGRAYLATPMPPEVAAPAMDPGLALGLLAELYAQTGDEAWIEGALVLSETVMERYGGADLPRGAAGIDWYESQMGPGFLLHGLARTAMLALDEGNCPLDADFTAR